MRVIASMNDQDRQAKMIESLRSLLERLGSSELTLPEAKLVRCQIIRLLGEDCAERQKGDSQPHATRRSFPIGIAAQM
jgi:hypothetical protein